MRLGPDGPISADKDGDARRGVMGKVTMHNRFHGFSIDGHVVGYKRGGAVPL